MQITFSDFLKLLYNNIGGEDKRDFVITVTDRIMPRPGAYNSDGVFLNPMRNKRPDYRGVIFRDPKRSISRKDATKILGNLDKYKFEKFIDEFGDDTRCNIAKDLTTLGVSSVNRDNVGEKCADIFEAILKYGKYEE